MRPIFPALKSSLDADPPELAPPHLPGFDSLKYDLKRVEEIRYDLSLRGLSVTAPAPAEKAATE